MDTKFAYNSLIYEIIDESKRTVSLYSHDINQEKKRIIIPQYVTYKSRRYKVVAIESFALIRCCAEYIRIGKYITNLDILLFNNCINLSHIEIDKNNNVYCSHDGIVYNKEMTRLVKFPRNKQVEEFSIPQGVTHIEYGAFAWNNYIRHIHIPDSVRHIKQEAFVVCTQIDTITGASQIETIGHNAFSDCISLKTLPLFQSLKEIGYNAFTRTSIHSFNIPESIEKIYPEAFSDCKLLTHFTISGNENRYKIIDNVLFNQDKKSLHTYPANKKGKSYTIPQWVTQIESGAFSYANHLKTIHSDCEKLNIIESGAFAFTSIEKIILPSTSYICSNAFIHSAIKQIVFKGEEPPSTFGCEILPEDVIILVPYGSKRAYQYADLWCNRTIKEYYENEIPA